jgi:hypothetical protein
MADAVKMLRNMAFLQKVSHEDSLACFGVAANQGG